MKRKRMISGLLAALMLFTSGCSGDTADNGKVKLRVYLHNTSLLNNYAPYLQEAVPDVDIEFVVGRSSPDYYLFKQENGDLPDIMLVGTVSARESGELNEYLLDLSETETASSFYETYLESCREADGSVKWLPASCIANGILANTDLFEQYDIPLPYDYESFAAACKAFKEVGIIPYTSDFKYQYTCLYTLEGISIPTLMTSDGMSWRRNYESGLTDNLDENVWKQIFSQFERFTEDTGISAEEVDRGYTVTREDFRDGKIAMVRGMSNELSFYEEYHGTVLLPYFGETDEDNWLLTTPEFYTALSKELEKDTQKREAALKVLEAMYSQEGYNKLTDSFDFMLPYNRGIDTAVPNGFENLIPLIDSNHMYILMTSSALNGSAGEAIQGYLRGEFDIETAFNVMNSALVDPEKVEAETVIVLENGYSGSFDKENGNQAASSIANTMRKISGSDVLLAPSTIATGSLYAVGYTYEMADYAFQSSGNRIYTTQLSGAEINEFIRLAVEGYDSVNDPFSDQTLPIVSGFKITVEKTEEGYKLVDTSLNDNETYKFAIVDNPLRAFPLMEEILGADSSERFERSDSEAHIVWADYLSEGNQPETPTDYIELR